MEHLSQQDQEFVKEVAITGNKTQSVKKAYGIEDDNYAGVKGNRLLRNDKINTAIEEVKRTLAERIPDDLLEKVHLEGLQAAERIIVDGEVMGEKPDYGVRHKYLDSAYKLKGSYAPDKAINLNIDAEITNPHAIDLAKKYEEELKKNL